MNGSLDKYTFILYICIKLRNTPANTSYGSTITAVFFRITNKIADRYVSWSIYTTIWGRLVLTAGLIVL